MATTPIEGIVAGIETQLAVKATTFPPWVRHIVGAQGSYRKPPVDRTLAAWRFSSTNSLTKSLRFI